MRGGYAEPAAAAGREAAIQRNWWRAIDGAVVEADARWAGLAAEAQAEEAEETGSGVGAEASAAARPEAHRAGD